MNRDKRLLKIFKLGLNSNRTELITEIIDYIALEHFIEALLILIDFNKKCDIPFLKDYTNKVIKDLQDLKTNIRQTIPYREETTKVINHKDELIFRWESALKEIPKNRKKQ